MSHEITSTDQMVSGNNQVPWHGLGVVVEGCLTAQDALQHANLSWQVLQEPIFDGDMQIVASHVINRREDNGDVLGVVSKTWTPVQNTFLVEVAEALAQVGEDYKPVIETAGSLRGGKQVWALVRFKETEFHGSAHREYLLLSNAHDGSRALRGTLTDVRVVCNNTLTWAEAAQSQIKLTHTKNVEMRLEEAVKLLGWANESTQSTFAIYDALRNTKVSKDKVREIYTDIVFPALALTEDSSTGEKIVEEMLGLFENGAGTSGENAFDALNGLTDWVDHRRNYRDGDFLADRKMEFTVMGGPGTAMKKKVLKVLQETAS